MLHTSAVEHHYKLKRVTKRIEDAVHKDDLDDFFKTAYHLVEITEKDPATTAAQKAAATALRSDPDLRICRDICNGQKHFKLKNPASAVVTGATTRQGYGMGGYGKGGSGVGEQSVTIDLAGGQQVSALDVVRRVASKWNAIL
jgi:hypothetical protein